ncbi:NgoPII restriction endonuclease [Methanobrevibacter filiformis]|uniref:NgoPII restriction endonuclease n=1 Tax=Methanobrevibacter filiformis TaxID=55758 RepID=A0A166ESV4_9EURY|nr:NgoPII restriction endonuclease [Methanobrevibacter filiformis]
MWGIEHPLDVYSYLFKEESDKEFSIYGLMRKGKYDSFSDEDRKIIENDKDISIEEVKVKDPNNPAKLIESILIRG